MVDSFCTSLLIAKCSHRPTMLRFRYLASHKNSLTICNFWWVLGRLFWMVILHESSIGELLT